MRHGQRGEGRRRKFHAPLHTFGYDAISNRTWGQEARGTSYYTYDRHNRLTQEKSPEGWLTDHGYNAGTIGDSHEWR